jgi:hypothetical protein
MEAGKQGSKWKDLKATRQANSQGSVRGRQVHAQEGKEAGRAVNCKAGKHPTKTVEGKTRSQEDGQSVKQCRSGRQASRQEARQCGGW